MGEYLISDSSLANMDAMFNTDPAFRQQLTQFAEKGDPISREFFERVYVGPFGDWLLGPDGFYNRYQPAPKESE